MKILILTASNPYKTAGLVAYDLYKALNEIDGTEVKILTKSWYNYKNASILTVHSIFKEYLIKLLRQFKKIYYKLLKTGAEIQIACAENCDPDYSVQGIDQTITYYNSRKILKRAGFLPDAIIVLFMPYFLSFKNIYELNQITKAPIFLYMMDMAPMTGGCHYAWACKGYANKCGNCPAIYSLEEYDQSRLNWEFKREYIDRTDMTVIAGTEYQFRQLQNSSLFVNKKKTKILISVDQNIFQPGDKKLARKTLGLPFDKKIVFFGAGNIAAKRKGFKELFEALQFLNERYDPSSDIHLAVAGKGIVESEINMPFKTSFLGNIDHKKLAIAFQAADVFVCSSIEDSGPMMINQSIMTGTPVVSFEMGVAFDLVITGNTGYRAELKDSKDLAEGIKYILALNEPEYSVLSKTCRDTAFKLFGTKVQATKFSDLLQNCMTNDN